MAEIVTYYIGSQNDFLEIFEESYVDDMRRMYSENLWKMVEECFSEWKDESSAIGITYQGGNKIYQLVGDIDTTTGGKKEIGVQVLSDDAGMAFIKNQEDLDNISTKIKNKFLSIWDKGNGFVFPSDGFNTVKYLLDVSGQTLLKLSITGKYLSTENIIVKEDVEENTEEDVDVEENTEVAEEDLEDVYVVNLDIARLDAGNVRILKKDDKYIMYPNLSPFFRSADGLPCLRGIISKIQEISTNFNDADKATGEMYDIFLGIDDWHRNKDNMMSVDDFMSRKISPYNMGSIVTKDLLEV